MTTETVMIRETESVSVEFARGENTAAARPICQYYARSFGDPISRLFWHDGALCMGLLPGKEAAFWDLHDSGALSDLFSDRLLSPLNTMEVSSEATSQEFAAIYRLEETPRITSRAVLDGTLNQEDE